MKCYLINPETRTVSKITFDMTKIDEIHKAIGDKYFDIARAIVTDWQNRPVEISLFVDDEGGLNPENHTFTIGDGISGKHLAGLAVVAGGYDGEGNTLAPSVTLADLKANIDWHGLDKPIDTSFTIITF